LEASSKLNILVTGGNGFLGSFLLKTLSKKSLHEVTSLIRNKNPKGEKTYNEFLIPDKKNNFEWNEIMDKVDVVIHCAGKAHITKKDTKESLNQFRKANVDLTLEVAKEAVKAKVKRFIFISTIKVNGEITNTYPFKINDEPNPSDAYASSKYEAETQLASLCKESELETVIIRPPLIYGPGVKGNLALLFKFIKLGLPLPLRKVEGNKRSFIGIENLVDLIVKCVDHPRAANKTFLVSDGCDLSTTELIRKIGKAISKPAKLFNVPLPLMKFLLKIIGKKELTNRLFCNLQVDINYTCSELDWSPPLQVEEGLKICH